MGQVVEYHLKLELKKSLFSVLSCLQAFPVFKLLELKWELTNSKLSFLNLNKLWIFSRFCKRWVPGHFCRDPLRGGFLFLVHFETVSIDDLLLSPYHRPTKNQLRTKLSTLGSTELFQGVGGQNKFIANFRTFKFWSNL